MILIAVGFAVGEGEVVVEIAQHLTGGDVALLVTVAADFIAQLQLGRGVAGVGDVVDGAAQSQRAAVEAIGTTEHLGATDPQRLQQLVRRAAGAGQRQAVEQDMGAGGVRAGATVDTRAAHADLHAFVAGGLR